MIVDVVLLQDSAPVVIEIDAHLFSTVDPIVPQYGLTTYRKKRGGEGGMLNHCNAIVPHSIYETVVLPLKKLKCDPHLW